MDDLDMRTCRCGHPAYGHLNPVNIVMPVPAGLAMCFGCPADLADGGCPGFVEQTQNGPDAPATSGPPGGQQHPNR